MARRRHRAMFVAAVAGAATVLPAAEGHADAGSGPVGTSRVLFRTAPGAALTAAGLGSYRGALLVGPTDQGLGVVDQVGFEDYVAGISEVPANWPMAALEAQAVAARTYALWQVLVGSQAPWSALGGQICATDACQVYRGLDREEAPDGARWTAAVQATAGQVLLYRGRVIEAVYGSSDGGRTIYGGVPWLPSVSDPDDAVSPEHHWSWSMPLSALAPVLGVPKNLQLQSLVSRPDAIVATLASPDGSTTTRSMDPPAFHALLNARLSPPAGLPLPLPSWRYSVSTAGTDVAVDGAGAGNGMGLSQYGALGKALRGFSAPQILEAYYGGVGPSRLGAAQEPSMISVSLTESAPSLTVQGNGPVEAYDGNGRLLARAEAGTWTVRPAAGGGVILSPPPGASGPPPATPVPVAPTTTLAPVAVPESATRSLAAADAVPERPEAIVRGPGGVRGARGVALLSEAVATLLLAAAGRRRLAGRPSRH